MTRPLLGALPGALLALPLALSPGAAGADERRSGFDDMSPALQALQRDETQNPGQLWVHEGATLWSRRPAAGRACVECHASASLPVIAPRHPRWDPEQRRPLTLAASIDRCRQRHQQAAPQGPDGAEVLALAAYLGAAARGRPIEPDASPALDAWQQRGGALFRRRIGQLNLACAHCHDQRAGGRLGGALIPQAHPTGYPAYRLEWQTLGSLQRRLRNCLVGVRAEPWPPAADEWLALEVHLMRRAAGMALEVPAVRP